MGLILQIKPIKVVVTYKDKTITTTEGALSDGMLVKLKKDDFEKALTSDIKAKIEFYGSGTVADASRTLEPTIKAENVTTQDQINKNVDPATSVFGCKEPKWWFSKCK